MTVRLDQAERDFITKLAPTPDGLSKHAAFIYGLLREPLFDTVVMAHAMAETPLTEESMTYIATRWDT
jgi:hypothetical protein